MTRINTGVHPSELTREHLIAEHREIKRIPNTIRSGKAKISNIPSTFRLGAGHVKFFYNKLGYLLRRYKAIHKECKIRGYDVQDYSSCWDGIPSELMGEYEPSEKDREIILNRINIRLSEKV
jgi:deoxyribonuclease (pyrimidine dimer)